MRRGSAREADGPDGVAGGRRPQRQAAELLDRLRETPRRLGLYTIKQRLNADEATRGQASIDRRLRNLTAFVDEREVRAYVVALGGSERDVATAVRLFGEAADAAATPRGSASETPARIWAPDRDALAPPKELPAVPRLAKIERALLREPRGGVAVLVGEGGLGKPLALGQVLDRVDARDDRWPWSCAVLVSCVRVVLDGPSRLDADDIDREFARARTCPMVVCSTCSRRCARPTAHRSCSSTTWIFLLTEATFRAIADFLARATSVCDVLVTCRTYEFEDYFTDLRTAAPQLCGRVRAVPVPELTASEIVEWTRAYLTRDDTEPDAAQQAFLDALRGGMERPKSRSSGSAPCRSGSH